MTKEYWQESFQEVCKQITDYEESKTPLIKAEVGLLYKEKQFWLGRCEHWDLHKEDKWEYAYREDYTGSYGCNTLYHIEKCLNCSIVLQKTEIRSR